MKYFISIIMVMFLLGFSMFSGISNANAGKCESLEKLATAIMKKRQQGYPMSGLVKAIEEVSDSKKEEKVFKMIIIEAYDVPYFHTEEMKMKSIRKFGNEMYKYCLKNELKELDE